MKRRRVQLERRDGGRAGRRYVYEQNAFLFAALAQIHPVEAAAVVARDGVRNLLRLVDVAERDVGDVGGQVFARAAAVVVMGEDALKAATTTTRGVEPLARIVDYEIAGVAPEVMGIGPVPAVRALLERQNLTLAEIDLVELNEAFAAQVIACDRELNFDPARLNVNGGAIALGHPIGCTGVRITTTLLHEMQRRNLRRGLATLCVSGGLGLALLVERV